MAIINIKPSTFEEANWRGRFLEKQDKLFKMKTWLNENAKPIGESSGWWFSGSPSSIVIVDDEIAVLFKLKFDL